MNRPESLDPPAAADDESIDELLVAFDDALASGTTPPVPDATAIPDQLLPRLRSTQMCLALLHEAHRARHAESLAEVEQLSSSSAHLQSLGPATRVGRFELVRELGRGGHGVVYLAFDSGLGRYVALKIPRPEVLVTPELARRFLREAQAAASLAHRNLVTIHEVGQHGPFCYIAAAYCSGPNMAAWLKSRSEPVDCRDAAHLVAELADAVEHAHQKGILHRDIKPSNVLLELSSAALDGPPPATAFVPKLSDFGLAKLKEEGGDATRTGALLGTPAYMAPEQLRGERAGVGPATDVYGLGAVLYELLTLRRAFQAASDVDTLRQVEANEPTPVRRLRPTVPKDLEAICLTCLEKRPQRRYVSAAALAADLRRFLAGEPTHARAISTAQRAARWAARNRAAAALVGVSAASIVLAFAGLVWHSSQLSLALKVSDERRAFAEQMQQQARVSQSKALAQETIANEHLYASRMRLAYLAAEQGNSIEPTAALTQYEPPSRWTELRGFEWHYLKGQLHRERLLLQAHGEAYALAFAPDGTLVSGGEDGTIKLWQTSDGRELTTIAGHTSCVNSLSITPDGRLMASGSCDRTVRLWDLEQRLELISLPEQADFVACVVFSPDGRQLAVLANDGQATIYDVATQTVAATFNFGAVGTWLDWSPDGKLLAAGSYQRAVQVWECGTWVPRNSLHAIAYAGVFLPNTNSLVLSTPHGAIGIWNAQTGVLERTCSHHHQAVALAASPDGRWVASSGNLDHVAKTWSTEEKRPPPQGSTYDQRPRQVLLGHRSTIKDVRFSRDGQLMATAGRDGTIRVWDAAPREGPVPVVECAVAAYVELASPHRVAATDDLNRLAVCSSRGAIDVWEIAEPSAPRQVAFPVSPTADDVAVVAGGTALLVADTLGGTFQVFPWDRSSDPQELQGHAGGIVRFETSADGGTLVSIGWDGVLRVQDVRTGNQRYEKIVTTAESPEARQLTFAAVRAHLSPDGQRLLLGGLPNTATTLVNLATGESMAIEQGTGFLSAFSADGRWLATAVQGPAVVMIDTLDGRTRYTLRPEQAVHSLAFSPDGRTLATGSDRVELWQAGTGQEIASFDPLPGQVTALKFSLDNRRLGAFAYSSIDTTGRFHVYSAERVTVAR